MAAPAFDNVSSVSDNDGDTVMAWTHTVNSNTNGILMVGVLSGLGIAISSVKYATVSMTEVTNSPAINGNMKVHLFYLLLPATGANTVEVTMASNTRFKEAGATSWTGVNQTTPLGTWNENGGTSATATVDITSAVDEIVLDVVGVRFLTTDADQTIAVGAGQTERWNVKVGFMTSDKFRCGGSSEAGAATVTMSWAVGSSASRDWAIGGVPIKPLAAIAARRAFVIS